MKIRNRAAVTLVELLVVMVVIGILVGILVPVLGPMIWRSNEFVIQSEISQLETAIDQFNNEYGFYPTDFSEFDGLADADAVTLLKQYLVKIAPNHTQSDAQLLSWWQNVGTNLDPSSALVFWLSGLRDSAQYPLTDSAGTVATAYSFDGGAAGDRKVFFDFQSDRLTISGNVATYGQAKGNSSLPYIYFSANAREFGGSGYREYQRLNSASPNVFQFKYFREPLTGDYVMPYLNLGSRPDTFQGLETSLAANTTEFFKPNSFQIIAAGLDNRYGGYGADSSDLEDTDAEWAAWSLSNFSTGNDNPNWSLSHLLPQHRDNVVNFKDQGRLDSDLE